jgi:hypothetical protein
MRKILALILMLGSLFPSFISTIAAADPDTVVTITSPPHAQARRYYLFPLKIPAYVVRGVTWPLVQGFRLVDRKLMKGKGFQTEGKTRRFFFLPRFQVGGGEGVGIGAGLKLNDLLRVGELIADYTFFLDVDSRANLLFAGDPVALGGRALHFDFLVQFRNRRRAAFFGLGSGTKKSSEGVYAYNQLTAGVDVDYEILKNLHLTLPLQFMTAEAAPGHPDSRPSVQAVFPSSELGAFRERTNYFLTGLSLAHDTRDSDPYPLKGGYRAVRFTRFQAVGSDFSFNQYGVDLLQYIPLWADRYVLALRNTWVFQQAAGDSGVPFNLLAGLDHYSPLRGFPVGRFRDESSVLSSIEYRFPIWLGEKEAGPFIDGLIFVDTGRVFPGIKDFSFDDWRYSVGGGLNFLMNNRPLLRFEAGYGGEGATLFLTLGGTL